MIEAVLRDILEKVAGTKNAEVEFSEKQGFGDLSTSLALKRAKEEGRNPLDLAKELAEKIKAKAPAGFFSAIEVAPPGFINISLSENALTDELQKILEENANYGASGKKQKEKIQVEFVSANPTGPLTLANGRGGFLGDALANVLVSQGYGVEREYYVNDTGNQIITLGKSILAAAKIIPREENFYGGDYISSWAETHKKDIEKLKEDPLELGRLAAKDFLASIKETLKRSGISFDRFTSEHGDIQETKLVSKILKIFEEKNLAYKNEGALWLKTTEFGDDKDRVLVTSDGFPTYFLADAAHYLETKERGFDRKINILGPDHYGYVSRIQAAAKIVGLESEIIVTQAIRLVRGGKEVKMSKREGVFVPFEEVIKEVGTDAARYFFLSVSPNTHIDFDLDLAKERSVKNPIYYVQYAHARAASVINKAADLKAKIHEGKLSSKEDLRLMKELARFPGILAGIAGDHEVSRLIRYVFSLARAFHDWYEKERVIGEEEKTASSRLALVLGTKTVLKNALAILGISAPEEM